MDTITCLWVQDKLDEISIMCINSWLKLGYKVDLYTYSKDFENEWANTQYCDQIFIKDASEIYDNQYDIKRLEFVADIFRFNLFKLNKVNRGSLDTSRTILWCDTDQYLIRKIPEVGNFVSSQLTLATGAFKHKYIRQIPNIGVMCFDGWENVDWKEILDKGLSCNTTEFQSGFLKHYEKIIIKYDYACEASLFCPIHWAWAKDIYCKSEIDINKSKYGLTPIEFQECIDNKKIIGLHLWRQLYKKSKWKITEDSIYNKLKKLSSIKY